MFRNTLLLDRIYMFIALCLVAVPSCAEVKYGLSPLLDSLDVMIMQQDKYVKQKEDRIRDVRSRIRRNANIEELYTMNSLLYDEYYVYDADTALNIAKRNLDIARSLDKKDWEAEWNIKASFIYAATGMMSQSMEQLETVKSSTLPVHLKVELYRQYIYIYSHYGQYAGESDEAKEYYAIQGMYVDSILELVSKDDPLYLWQKAWGPKPSEVKDELVKAIKGSALDSRIDAMNAYCLAHINEWEGNEEDHIRYLIYSAMADLRCCNRDIAAMEELAKWLFAQGEIDYSFRFINYCMDNDRLYHNRVHMISLSEVNSDIHNAYMSKSNEQQSRLRIAFYSLIFFFVILVGLVLLVLHSMRRVKSSKAEVAEANRHLQESNMELEAAQRNLSEANSKLNDLNARLTEVNEQLTSTNAELRDTNYVKEEMIGYVFSVCSQYISKQEEYRKRILRQLKTGKIDEVMSTVEKPIQQKEMKEFYQTFDQVFLSIYPNFIEDFNSLLRPEERVYPRDGELLNTELRIYALVRLGINDSVKIADFLHCSVQTVYNNRLRCRNKSIVPKGEFAQTVMELGKMKYEE